MTGCDKQIYEELAVKAFGVEKGKEMANAAEKACDVVVNVEPGTYRLRYFLKREEGKELHATLTKIKR